MKKTIEKTIGGIVFRKVGKNASHDFYIAKLGRWHLVYSIGEGVREGEVNERLTVHESLSGVYLGHV